MKLGIDFGTTHTVAALTDQGNFPVVNFSSPEGDWFDYFPSLIAVNGTQVKFGFEAYQVLDNPNWTLVRSVKSLLKHIGQNEVLEIEGHRYGIKKLLIDFFSAFKEALSNASSLDLGTEPISASVAVPANTNNTQRFVTQDAFTGGGFDLINVLNEPSAATMEYTRHFFRAVGLSPKRFLLVYDLGGGTFDASVAEIHDHYHQIIATQGIEDLGGDQFDQVLAEMVMDAAGIAGPLSYAERVSLLEMAREKKESLTPHSKSLLFEWAPKGQAPQVIRIEVKDYLTLCEPLVDRTLAVTEALIERVSGKRGIEGLEDFTAVYLVGGMANFPLVARKLKQLYGQHKVKKSHHAKSSVAIGLAILGDSSFEDLVLKESLTRHFGLWREGDKGESLVFDLLFEKDQPLPAKNEPPLVLRRRYRPSHNIGVFRFQECGALEEGRPTGLVTVWRQINCPFDPQLLGQDLGDLEVTRTQEPLDFEVEELYSLNHQGEISFTVINHWNGHAQTFQLSRMSAIQ
ncbi:MAG: hypothetical protein A2600_03715 [Candidatus Lambdaproteobacteria bacterium RIFOXYD1_FULL_56_27]|uniref:Hsp70 family protein n=1 Tax=Candidatus Lambdaproteobacteria bacterium RIFOXYD2_FULL_56_26 TaxID=1817773 RepID=A0A1F6H3J0_9PROT|nr:MAG: hypothetical protein A2426_11775 [Candidatus Lambdaproteobacteria bacterium RIFOXYC1_FULL_56_13]OGH04870.1 MAG: hypothetical protein A2557_07780 [Candidatus Lambdaproteobacteria bacterium RIFOXYD2_FULL_56_26]OGH09335.1 MAG: hypothetical protein A2600_03715 [Candidatus Lambdaproteobacteria bacterium RIFOXYD1_FULL_56_27]